MADIEEIKRKRMEELQQQIAAQQMEELKEQIQLERQVAMLESIAKQKMTKEAITRYGNLKAAHPEKAIQVIAVIAQAIQQGQITEQLTDEKLKNILMQIKPEKREFKITKK